MAECESCKVPFEVDDLVVVVRKVTKVRKDGFTTDRMYSVIDGYQHADPRVCEGHRTFQENLERAHINARMRASKR